MATTPDHQTTTITDDEARLRVSQIFGSDLTAPAWTGDWHQALKDTSARWTETSNLDLTV